MADKIELPKTVTKTLFITIGVGTWNLNDINVMDFDRVKHSTEVEHVLLKTQEVTFDLSDLEIVDEGGIKSKIVEQLKDQQEQVKADSHMKIKGIQDKIDNLLAIEYKSEAAATMDDIAAKVEESLKEKQHPKKNTISG